MSKEEGLRGKAVVEDKITTRKKKKRITICYCLSVQIKGKINVEKVSSSATNKTFLETE